MVRFTPGGGGGGGGGGQPALSSSVPAAAANRVWPAKRRRAVGRRIADGSSRSSLRMHRNASKRKGRRIADEEPRLVSPPQDRCCRPAHRGAGAIPAACARGPATGAAG